MTESNDPHKAQLDKAEREQLEDIVTQMRERVEGNVRFQLTQRELDNRPEQIDELDSETEQLVEAIDLEATDDESWSEALDKYVTSVGYTIVNRLTALRCMEVREFIDKEVTVFKQNGLTPAAETLVQEEFLLEDEAILEAYHNACDTFAEEIEILFDRSSAYSLIDPDDDTFEELCEMLDSVPSRIWRADDVLGWVYEYYNVKLLDDLRRKGDREGLEPEDVPPANQFYTPHWVVRMLTDNSLGKLYLEHTGELQDVVETQEAFSPDERKNRPLSPDESPDVSEFCTYLVPSEQEGEPTDFEHPEELRVIDPACGSGHFLLYAFDVLERIWRAETDLDKEEIPQKILHNNIYGVDLDMRACQLAAFNLYLKGRTRAEAEGANGFDMPEVGIVCADAKVADTDGVESVFDEVAGDDPEIKDALGQILDAFEQVHGIGSLLNVRGTLGDLFEDDSDSEGVQITLDDDPKQDYILGQVLHNLREAVEEHRDSNSFLAQDLQSFLRLLDILAQDYDVALMNPPYGSKNRMPTSVQNYVNKQYRYSAEFYVNFFEVCESVTKTAGRIGMLVPRTFMFKQRYKEFRTDFVGERGSFEFLSEFGIGVLDNATVRTVGTVVQSGANQSPSGEFIRLHDLASSDKEKVFTKIISDQCTDVKRLFSVDLEEFSDIPSTPICYSTPKQVRGLHQRDVKLDAEQADANGDSLCTAIPGLQTSDDERFARLHWEVDDFETHRPISKGGSDAWILPTIQETVEWGDSGHRIRRSSKSVRIRNEDFYGTPGLTWTYIKETGRRFGYYPGGLFSHAGFMIFPRKNISLWKLLSALNSDLYHALFLSQTTDRHWNAGEVGSVPWLEEISDVDLLSKNAKKQFATKLELQFNNPISPYYIGSGLLPKDYQLDLFYDHPHTEDSDITVERNGRSKTDTISELAHSNERAKLKKREKIENLAAEIENTIYEQIGFSDKTVENIQTEIRLRTSRDSEDRKIPNPDSVSEIPDNIDEQVKGLILHFGMEAVRKEADGIVPLHSTNEQADMLDCIIERFENAYGKHAKDRLAEVDDILGTESATEEAYPNLRTFVAKDLFTYHVDVMENTPILWKLTTERLITDSSKAGFACFVDYHSLDSGLLDRLVNQYLDPRKTELREQRSAANRRRSDNSLSTSEQAEAAKKYERCVSGINQISAFEDVLQELSSTTARDFDPDSRELINKLAPKVTAFRKETQKRVDTLVKLRNRNGEAWFQDTFSDNFWSAVDEWREEWVDALSKLEQACEEYAKPADKSVEAHLADLFDYFSWRLKGSDHYSSTGILFMTYYFDREGTNLLNNNGDPFDTLTHDEHLLGSLAMGVGDASIVNKEYLKEIADDRDVDSVDDLPPLAEFKALAEEIDDRCQVINERISSDWTTRALSEITTEGYQPNHNHGVEINIEPLAEAEIVPKTVDTDVL